MQEWICKQKLQQAETRHILQSETVRRVQYQQVLAYERETLVEERLRTEVDVRATGTDFR